MSDHVFSTKPGATDGLSLGKPIGGGASLNNTSNLTSSGGTTGLTGSGHGLSGGSADPARNVADTPAGVAAGLGVGHHNQGQIHDPSATSGSRSAGGLSGTTDRLAQATATSGNTHTGAIGGNPVSRNDNLTDYKDKDIVTPNIGSGSTGTHGSHGSHGLAAAGTGAGASGLASHGTHDHSHDSQDSHGMDGFNTAPVHGTGATGHNHLHLAAAQEGLAGKPASHRVEPEELARRDGQGTIADHGAAGVGLVGTGIAGGGAAAAAKAVHGSQQNAIGGDHGLTGTQHGAHQNTTAGDRGLTGTQHGGPTAYESDASRVGGHYGTSAGAGLAGAGLAGAGVAAGTHGHGSATQGSGVGHGVVGTGGGADATDATRGTGLTGKTGLAGGNSSNSVDALKQELKEHQSGSSHVSRPESQGPHGLVWHNGKYVHQREIDQHGSTGVPLVNAFKDAKSGGEHGINTNTDSNNTRV